MYGTIVGENDWHKNYAHLQAASDVGLCFTCQQKLDELEHVSHTLGGVGYVSMQKHLIPCTRVLTLMGPSDTLECGKYCEYPIYSLLA